MNYYIVNCIMIAIFLGGCNFLEVQVTTHQSARQVDSTQGEDDTVELHRGTDSTTDTDTTETVIKTIP